MQIAGSVLDLVGNTPLVALDRIGDGLPSRLLGKCEFLNPGGSIKDRCALYMVRKALADGRLRPDQPVVELTSGNMGTGLAIACRQLGLRFIAVMSRGNSIERRKMMAAMGAEVELVDQAPGSPPGQVSGDDLARVETRTMELVAEHGAFYVDQFHNADNVESHEATTGEEIWRQTDGAVDAFVTAAGTGCTYVGVMRRLRSYRPEVRGYVVEPAAAAPLAHGRTERASHKIQGTGYGEVQPLWDRTLCDGSLLVTDDEALATARRLAAEEGLFVGFSAGANVAAALQLARGDNPPQVIVTLLVDTGMKYLSTDLVAG